MAVIVTYLHRVSEVLWAEKFWLPTNLTWNDISPPSNEQLNYTSGTDLLLTIPIALLLISTRYCLERWCFRPLGLYLGLPSNAHKKIPPIPILETAHVNNVAINHDQIVGMSKQLDWTERQVERWLRLRRTSEKPTTLVKFTESGWRFFFYTGSSMCGAYCIWDKPWVWHSMLLVSDLPHPITTDCWLYCLLSCGFYLSLLLSQFSDVKRKDFLEMTIHHSVAITLVSLCWITNAHRFMVLGFFMFDMSDVILEFLKMTKYAQFQKTATGMSMLMLIVWFSTRWVWYPLWILRATLVNCLEKYGMCGVYVFGNALLLLICALNAMWSYYLLKCVFFFLIHGGARTQDSRSSGEEDESEDHQGAN